MKELEVIKHATINDKDSQANVYAELRQLIEEKTNMYSNPEAISTEKVDMTDAIKRYGYDVEDYKKMFGSTMRSEMDVVKLLAKNLSNEPGEDDDADEKLALRVRIAKAKAKALALKMKMKSFTF